MRKVSLKAGNLEAAICPEAGANVFSLRYGGRELLRTPPSLEELPGHGYGIPLLFPFPGRIRDSRFNFEGKTYEFPGSVEKPAIHGFACQAAWELREADSRNAVFVLEVGEGSKPFEHFPWAHQLKYKVSLSEDSLCLDFEVLNKDDKNLPFGFGLHPYFHIHGSRDLVRLRIPARKCPKTEGRWPTGELEPLEGGPLDFQKGTPLGQSGLDLPLADMAPNMPWEMLLEKEELLLSLRPDSCFDVAVLFAPSHADFFCLEPWTTIPNAHNLHAQGIEMASGLRVLAPGESFRAGVRLKIESLRTIA